MLQQAPLNNAPSGAALIIPKLTCSLAYRGTLISCASHPFEMHEAQIYGCESDEA